MDRRPAIGESPCNNRWIRRRIAYRLPTWDALRSTSTTRRCTLRSPLKTRSRTAISAGFYRQKVAGYRPIAHSARRGEPTTRRISIGNKPEHRFSNSNQASWEVTGDRRVAEERQVAEGSATGESPFQIPKLLSNTKKRIYNRATHRVESPTRRLIYSNQQNIRFSQREFFSSLAIKMSKEKEPTWLLTNQNS